MVLHVGAAPDMTTINKALGLLDFFSGGRPEIGLSEFKSLSGYDKGTVHRYLNALRTSGFVEQDTRTRRYRLGPALARLAMIRDATVPLAAIVRAELAGVAEATGELVHAAVPMPGGMSALFARDGGIGGTRVGFNEAELLPYHATSSGIAMLAFGPESLAARVLPRDLARYTDATYARAEIEGAVAAAQKAGFAATDETFEAEVCSVAVPFFGRDGAARGTLAIATPASRMTPAARLDFARTLVAASRTICRELGAQVPKDLQRLWTTL